MAAAFKLGVQEEIHQLAGKAGADHAAAHIPAWTEFGEGNLYLNPGSVSIPKEGSAHSYMTLEGETFLWKTLEGEVYRELEL